LPFTIKEQDTKRYERHLDTVGSIDHRFKVKGTVVTLPGQNRKRKL